MSATGDAPAATATSAGGRSARVVRRRAFLLMWAAGLPGVVAVAAWTVPTLTSGAPAPPPLPTFAVAAIVAAQSALLLAVAVWVGLLCAPAVGWSAPAFDALARGEAPWPALRPQLAAGALGGLAGAAVLVAYAALAPEPLSGAAAAGAAPPLAVRLLYGGVTEELLVRWGLTMLLARLCRALLQRRGGPASAASCIVAIALGALAFAAAHLPAAIALAGPLPPAAVGALVAANAAFGAIAGVLLWRRGLEAAIVAHGLAHALAWAATG